MRGLLLPLLLLLLTACATRERVVLLPGADGRTGAVVVETAGGNTEINVPYADARIGGGGRVQQGTLTEQQVTAEFGGLMAALPRRPKSFALYFLGDSDELTSESKGILPQMLKEITEYPFPEVLVIGHTDTLGAQDYNDRLSRARAAVVVTFLVQLGVSESSLEVQGRGEREPALPTADEVAEPRNRRVQIQVR